MAKRYTNTNIVVCFVFDWKLLLSCHSLMATPMFGKIPIRGFSSKEFNTRYTIALHSTVKSFIHRPGDKSACDLHHAQIKAFYRY